MRERKGLSRRLISAKKIFTVHENYQARQISFMKFNFQENFFVCGLTFTDFDFSLIALSKLIYTNFFGWKYLKYLMIKYTRKIHFVGQYMLA